MKEVISQLKILFKEWADEDAVNINPLVQSGSYRKYFRISGKGKSAIGVFNNDKKENHAFISFTKQFLNKGLNVPLLYANKQKENIYLLQDLGDTTLFNLVEDQKIKNNLSTEVINYYKASLTHLIRFQIDGGKGLDYSKCYPSEKFDKQAILWDLNYFKYNFLKLLQIPFDEQKLENDFKTFSEFILSTDSKYFMYRDFQSRNILVHKNDLYFVDFQGGRKGALQYDVASLLFQAKVNLPKEIREELLDHYLKELSKRSKISKKEFKKYFHGFVLVRILQTLGAYGFRGYYERKPHFLLSIPYALQNLQWLVDENHIPKNLIELRKVLDAVLTKDELRKNVVINSEQKLKVTINSFSYKENIPYDFTGNGGGFVFDCRSIENPGRFAEFKESTGLDENVIRFLNDKKDAKEFLKSIFEIVDNSIANYLKRDFKNLLINFGCTGGQHRSVYFAEELANHIKEKFNILIEVNHTKLKHPEFK